MSSRRATPVPDDGPPPPTRAGRRAPTTTEPPTVEHDDDHRAAGTRGHRRLTVRSEVTADDAREASAPTPASARSSPCRWPRRHRGPRDLPHRARRRVPGGRGRAGHRPQLPVRAARRPRPRLRRRRSTRTSSTSYQNDDEALRARTTRSARPASSGRRGRAAGRRPARCATRSTPANRARSAELDAPRARPRQRRLPHDRHQRAVPWPRRRWPRSSARRRPGRLRQRRLPRRRALGRRRRRPRPRNGQVLAMASYPTYDPSEFIGGISHRRRTTALNADGQPRPAHQPGDPGQYAPGSTFKLFTRLRRPRQRPDHAATRRQRPRRTTRSRDCEPRRREAAAATNSERKALRHGRPARGPHRVERRVLLQARRRHLAPPRPARRRRAASSHAAVGFGAETGIGLPGEADRAGPRRRSGCRSFAEELNEDNPATIEDDGTWRPATTSTRGRPGRRARHAAAARQRLRHLRQRRHAATRRSSCSRSPSTAARASRRGAPSPTRSGTVDLQPGLARARSSTGFRASPDGDGTAAHRSRASRWTGARGRQDRHRPQVDRQGRHLAVRRRSPGRRDPRYVATRHARGVRLRRRGRRCRSSGASSSRSPRRAATSRAAPKATDAGCDAGSTSTPPVERGRRPAERRRVD